MERLPNIRARLDRRREEIVSRYPAIWDKIITGWKSPGLDDHAWLMYSANYLFQTGGIRWAIDPLTLKCRLPQAPVMEIARDLKDLDFVLLTHQHKDHLDFDLLRALQYLPICWVIPEAILPMVQREVGLPAEQVLVPKPLQPITLHGISITPFIGLHWEDAPGFPDGRRGVPAVGYLVEHEGRRWLFPGDTRKYDSAGLPDFGPVDLLFAHLWLGRGTALQPSPRLLDDFCRFCLGLHPRRVVLTHLEEWGRQVADFWDMQHVEQVVSILNRLAPLLPVEVACMGEDVSLVID